MRIKFVPGSKASDDEKKEYLISLSKELGVDLPKEYVSPVEEIIKLEDEPTSFYFWKVKEAYGVREQNELIAEIYTRFVKTNGRDPKSIHFIGHQLEDIKKYNAEELQEIVFPWLKAELRDKLTKA